MKTKPNHKSPPTTTTLALRNGSTAKPSRKIQPSHARTRIWKAAFLKALAKVPNITLAAKAAHISPRTAYNAKDSDPAFSELWLQALNASVDKVEAKVFQQAIDGDPQLAMFVLKAHRPSVYRETSRMEIDQRFCGVLLLPSKEKKDP